MAETSTKPYLVRALYEWCCDNGYTPYLAVSVDSDTIDDCKSNWGNVQN